MRNAYLLSTDHTSERALHSHSILSKLKFNVIKFDASIDADPFTSKTKNMQAILSEIISSKKRWSYIFEDGIQFWNYVHLKYLIAYEKHASRMFYLGAKSSEPPIKSEELANNQNVYRLTADNVEFSHAFAISSTGAKLLLEAVESHFLAFDKILFQTFMEEQPIIVDGDKKSFLDDTHYGLVFQDRLTFPPLDGERVDYLQKKREELINKNKELEKAEEEVDFEKKELRLHQTS